MLSSILPYSILQSLDMLSISKLNEIRLRVDKPVVIQYDGTNYYLNYSGICKDKDNAIISSKEDIDYVISKATDNSLYAVNDQLIDGYLSVKGGIRIGLCGELVKNDSKIVTLKNITSINIRIPHMVKNCSLRVYDYIINNGNCKNTLVISPPGCGKTTFIRDIIYQMCLHEANMNILVADERCEISGYSEGEDYLQIGQMCDVYMNCSKSYAFSNGIRSMRPDVIVCDELNLDKDIECLINAITCGVKVIASIHANDINELQQKSQCQNLINNNLFDRYIVLSSRCGIGTIERVYDKNFSCICVSGE